jgi:uncharacterized lipoprotein YajG
MRTITVSAISVAIILMAGCDKAKSPDAVAQDVAAAEQKASTNNAAGKVDDKLVDLNNVAANDAYKLASAKADGDLKVALANCSAVGGDAQKTCKDQAESDYKSALAAAKTDSQAAKQ